MKVQDYIWFRLHQYYFSKKDIPFFSSILFLSVIHLTLLFFLFVIVNIFSGGMLSSKNSSLSPVLFNIVFFGPIIILLLLCRNRYQNNQQAIYARFNSSIWNKKIKMWYIFLLPLFIIVMSISIAVLNSKNR
jgi:hypothetical protein